MSQMNPLNNVNIPAIAAAGTTGSETTSPRDAEGLPFLYSGM